MSNLIDIFNKQASSKFDEEKLVGSSSFFNNLDEVIEFNKLEKKYISNVDYSYPSNFAKFGSAEEYYKNCINYINSEYPYDLSTSEKLNWINSLSEFEYYIFEKEFPRSTGHVVLDNDQTIVISSSIKSIESDSRDIFQNKKLRPFEINFTNGITFEGWLKFEDSNPDLLTIIRNTVTSSVEIFKITKYSNGFEFCGENLTWHQIELTVPNNEWHHYCFTCLPNKIQIFVDGQLSSETEFSSINIATGSYIIGEYGLFDKNEINTTVPNNVPPFVVGGGLEKLYLDEVRLWNGIKSPERIGRYWFTNVDGNDFTDPTNSSLIFYYKFNEGWDKQYQWMCLDYSGRQMDGEITSYNPDTCRQSESALDLSGLVQDIEKPEIIFKGLSYSQTVKDYYNNKIISGIEHDQSNPHMLYNKFPGWILEQEEENSPKYLKQTIQIISSYFDDLYNKIKEVSNYKNIKYTNDKNKIYPFYDKILTSTGFDITELFSNLDIVEKIASRNDTTLFDTDIQKIKNSIFQNIYNNLSYILKSKGTEKSIKSFLRSYGIDENLVKINLYSDNADYHIIDRSKEQIVKKKTITLQNGNCIYQANNSQDFLEDSLNLNYFTLETAVSFPQSIKNNTSSTSSIFGFYLGDNGTTSWYDSCYHYYVTLENDSINGSRFVLNKADLRGDTILSQSFSEYYKDLYDNTIWNLCLRKKPKLDTLYGVADLSNIEYNLELFAVNNNTSYKKEFKREIDYSISPDNGIKYYLTYFIGARNSSMTGPVNIPANSKFLYCNFWNDYLNNDIIVSHNKDILNYGTDE